MAYALLHFGFRSQLFGLWADIPFPCGLLLVLVVLDDSLNLACIEGNEKIL